VGQHTEGDTAADAQQTGGVGVREEGVEEEADGSEGGEESGARCSRSP
jgi:hypothetical protein